MSFLNILQAVFSLDFIFLIDLIMNNLFWVFGFIAAGYLFTDKKSFIMFGFVYAAIILMTVDVFNVIGFSIYTATGLMFLYLARMVVLLFLENTKSGPRLIPLAYVAVFFFTLAIAAWGFF